MWPQLLCIVKNMCMPFWEIFLSGVSCHIVCKCILCVLLFSNSVLLLQGLVRPRRSSTPPKFQWRRRDTCLSQAQSFHIGPEREEFVLCLCISVWVWWGLRLWWGWGEPCLHWCYHLWRTFITFHCQVSLTNTLKTSIEPSHLFHFFKHKLIVINESVTPVL